MARFEYKFVRLAVPGWRWNLSPSGDYHQVVADHARDGWRLVQVFAPGIGVYGAPKYFEIILEREV